jgi:hypothetical protein
MKKQPAKTTWWAAMQLEAKSHMTLALLKRRDWEIRYWEVANLRKTKKTQPLSATIAAAAEMLNRLVTMHDVTHLFVEQQSIRSRVNQQNLAYGLLGAAHSIAAQSKSMIHSGLVAPAVKNAYLKPFLQQAKPTYPQRKAASVTAVRAILEDSDESLQPWIDSLDSARKKDDLADSLLLALSVMDRYIYNNHHANVTVLAIDPGIVNCGLCILRHP